MSQTVVRRAPDIDRRSAAEISDFVRALLAKHTAAWLSREQVERDRQIDAIVQIFARMLHLSIERLNRVPEKHFLAFLDMLNIDLNPPRYARVPLSFFLSEGTAQWTLVPKGIQAATDSALLPRPVIFETAEDLTVIPAQITSVVSVDPQKDLWRRLESGVLDPYADSLATIFSGREHLPHRLYLDVPEFAALKENGILFLKFETAVPSGEFPAYDIQWYYLQNPDSEPLPLEILTVNDLESGPVDTATARQIENFQKSGIIKFKLSPGVEPTSISGFIESPENPGYTGAGDSRTWRGNFIFAECNFGAATDGAKILPELLSLSYKTAPETPLSEKIFTPEQAVFDDAILDTSKDFFIFGETPAFNDTFYFCSREVFSKKDAVVTLIFDRTAGLPAPESESGVGLFFEFFTGGEWQLLGQTGYHPASPVPPPAENPHQFNDATSALTWIVGDANQPQDHLDTANINFTCPAMDPVEIAGIENLWLRIRVVSGNYGKGASYAETDAGFELVPATLTPPSVSRIKIQYALTTEWKHPAQIFSGNNFLFRAHSAQIFRPFHRVALSFPAVYFGFNGSFSQLPVNLFFTVTLNNLANVLPQPPALNWEYWNGAAWSLFEVDDATNRLSNPGTIVFTGPTDAAKKIEFEENLYWIRATLRQQFDLSVQVSGIYNNTVWANQLETLRGENLGSSAGTPGQVFRFSHFPVLPGQRILVREDFFTAEDKLRYTGTFGADKVVEEPNFQGGAAETWVEWQEVPHFYFSDAFSRHYRVDHNQGTLTFGDSRRGMIPPAGRNNIRCFSYQVGGGKAGNVQKGIVTKLRNTLPYIDAMVNPIAGHGGEDTETAESVVLRGPQLLRSNDRAVTQDDFETITLESSSRIVKVKCLPLRNAEGKTAPGHVSILVLSNSNASRPVLDEVLRNDIMDYLDRRILTSLVDHIKPNIHLISPRFIEISVHVLIEEYSDLNKIPAINEAVETQLNKFLNPLSGGTKGNGWDFGRNVPVTEIYQLIENIEGVELISDISLNANLQLYKISSETTFIPRLKYERYSVVHITLESASLGENARLDLKMYTAHALTEKKPIADLVITGFKEGDFVQIVRRLPGETHGQFFSRLKDKDGAVDTHAVYKVLRVGDSILRLEIDAARTNASGGNTQGESTFANTDMVRSIDGRVLTYLSAEVTVSSDDAADGSGFDVPVVTPRSTVLPSGEPAQQKKITLFHILDPLAILTSPISGISGRFDLDNITEIFLEDDYLPYSGIHSVQKAAAPAGTN